MPDAALMPAGLEEGENKINHGLKAGACVMIALRACLESQEWLIF